MKKYMPKVGDTIKIDKAGRIIGEQKTHDCVFNRQLKCVQCIQERQHLKNKNPFNGRLIAAAPELLELARTVIIRFPVTKTDKDQRLVDLARNVIAKVEGV